MIAANARKMFREQFTNSSYRPTHSSSPNSVIALVHPLIDSVVGITKHYAVLGGQQLHLVSVNFRVEHGGPVDPPAVDRIGRDEFRPLAAVVAEPWIVNHPGVEAQIESKLTAGDDLGRYPGLPYKIHGRLVIPALRRVDNAVNYGP